MNINLYDDILIKESKSWKKKIGHVNRKVLAQRGYSDSIEKTITEKVKDSLKPGGMLMVPKDLKAFALDLVHKEGNINFKASYNWYQKFMKRH